MASAPERTTVDHARAEGGPLSVPRSRAILVLHHGRLIEEGTHSELVRLDEGIYRTLYTLQAAAG